MQLYEELFCPRLCRTVKVLIYRKDVYGHVRKVRCLEKHKIPLCDGCALNLPTDEVRKKQNVLKRCVVLSNQIKRLHEL